MRFLFVILVVVLAGSCALMASEQAGSFDSAVNLGAIEPGETVAKEGLAISEAGEQDCFRFTAGSCLYVDITVTGSFGGDTILTLYDREGIKITEDDDSGTGAYSALEGIRLEPGEYFILIREYQDDDVISEYSLSIVSSGACDNVPLPDSVRATRDKTAFLTQVGEGLEERGWSILIDPSESAPILGVTDTGLFNYFMSYSVHGDHLGRLIIVVVMVGDEKNRSEKLEEINRLNISMNLVKLSLGDEGRVWTESTVVVLGQLPLDDFEDYLRWYDDALERFIRDECEALGIQ